MDTKTNYVLVALSDSISSRGVINYLISQPLRPPDVTMVLLHIFRKSSASKDLMGKKFTQLQPARMSDFLKEAKEKVVENNYNPDRIEIEFVDKEYPAVSDGIIDQFKKRKYVMVVIGRKRMSKAEEFVLGDVSVKLVRALENTAVLVVKSI